ncbi:hypothetical protein [Desulfofustis glycolicus]|uniref:Hpr(Ser) kinase/phosphatase n=1 Tax=Desulfofustis glycolicus DSM 9705 TaxID=1121409 RepID=A0A1M5SWS2_9BACT|nr:hypothetical protein [Desulfofustis glycolicus]SHH42937.1 hypothetical protein SAMN02745124_00478 [Desulfofustis glycolicus DSM 9705]
MVLDSQFTVGIGGRSVEVHCLNREARALVVFLFADLFVEDGGEPIKRYEIGVDSSMQAALLTVDGSVLLEGGTVYRQAYCLMNEILEQCIIDNDRHHAVHAAAVSLGSTCLVLPGTSGAGKSTLTAWLVSRGFSYLTDELVMLDDQRVIAFTRPINLKKMVPFLAPLAGRCRDLLVQAREGIMIPHRLLGGNRISPDAIEPRVTHFIFPRFQAGESPGLQEISAAQSCLQLMQCHVNARNLEKLGIPSLARVIRNCRSFSLTYGDTADLEQFFGERQRQQLFGRAGHGEPPGP